ncbi:hypothetical protein AAF712_015719 [Marasmius tenuissimus]|uniref:Prolactin receptor n=1 Tax=Marasmius tenuissimus TaxID=585030 RepID=A0ABR2Z8K2_9AGAR
MLTPTTTNVALVPPSVTSTSECGEPSPKYAVLPQSTSSPTDIACTRTKSRLFIEFNFSNPNSYGVASGEGKGQDIRTKSPEPGRADVSDRAAIKAHEHRKKPTGDEENGLLVVPSFSPTDVIMNRSERAPPVKLNLKQGSEECPNQLCKKTPQFG